MTLNRMLVPALSLFLGATGLSAARAYGSPLGASSSLAAQDRDDWQRPPQDLRDMQRQGFHDGIVGASKDFDNHRRPDVNNRDEYRNPHLPPEQREAYQEGFRRGYDRGVSHFYGSGGIQQPMGGYYEQRRGPDRYGYGQDMGSDIQRRGFQDGMEGARKDLDNHRRPDVNNRDEYRHPNVPRQVRDRYRDAFRRGYEQYMSQQYGGRGRDRDRDDDRR
jgi:ribosome modulation factor